MASNKLRHVDLRTVALSDQPGQATLSVPVEDGVRIIGQATLREVGAGADEFTVAVTTLDTESMPGPVTFIKIDVEGHELALLRGAVGLLERDRPTLLIEVENRHAGDRVPQLAALLLDTLGYQAAELDPDGRLVPTERALWDAGDRLNTRPGTAT